MAIAKIMLSIMSASTSAECSFSALERVKTKRHNITGDERMSNSSASSQFLCVYNTEGERIIMRKLHE